jgi:GTP-binding protein HflX
VTDTVGFVRKLPHGLVEAFQSTLEGSANADLLLHVVDASHPEALAQVVAVHEVLEEIGADQVPEQLVLNKLDQADPDAVDALVRRLRVEHDADPVLVSAWTGHGIDELTERITLRLPGRRLRVEASVPYERQDLVALAHRRGTVVKEAHTATGTDLIADVDQDAALAMRDYLDEDPFAVAPEPWERED